MPFLIFSNVDIQFVEQELVWGTYSAIKTLSITQKIEIIDKKIYNCSIEQN